jgi:hypothetical protein
MTQPPHSRPLRTADRASASAASSAKIGIGGPRREQSL